MLASKDEYMNDAAQTMYLMSAEEQIRKRCRDREEYYQDLRNYERAIAERDDTIAEQETQIRKLQAEIERLKGKGDK